MFLGQNAVVISFLVLNVTLILPSSLRVRGQNCNLSLVSYDMIELSFSKIKFIWLRYLPSKESMFRVFGET